MKIIDTFIFNDEVDMLNVRLEMLYDVVDYFILVESDETFKGNSKPLYYTENKNNFSKYNDKIIVIINNSLEFKSIEHNEGNFARENFSRDIIKDSLINLNLDENDIVLHSDLDEIPNPNFLILVKNNIYNFTILSIKLELYYYNFETIDLYTKWYGTYLIYYKHLQNTMSYYRKTRWEHQWNINIHLDEPNVYGWHFSYFGDYQLIQNKLLSFSEDISLSSDVINNKDILYNLIKSKKLWFSNKPLNYINFETNRNLLKTHEVNKLYNKLKILN